MTRYRLHESLGYRLSVSARQQERRLDEQLRRIGLTRTTWCILLAVGNEEMEQPSDIASFVGIDRTATSRALRQMEDAGLLARENGTEDRRTRQVRLTAKGRNCIEKGTPFARENNQRLAQTLSDSDLEELKDLLDRIIAADDRDLSAL